MSNKPSFYLSNTPFIQYHTWAYLPLLPCNHVANRNRFKSSY